MITAKAIIRDMGKAGRQDEIEAISRTISQVAPELSAELLSKRLNCSRFLPSLVRNMMRSCERLNTAPCMEAYRVCLWDGQSVGGKS